MSPQPIWRWDRETALLAWLTAGVSIASFLFHFRRGDVLLYGDAVAHINIARRLFDSRTPGLLQLGTVWLPLPHLLMVPFLLSDWMWKTGMGGSIPSMAAYVFGVLGIFRLLRATLGFSQTNGMGKVAAWVGAIIYAANPNLIYLQATAMTEPLYLALFIWAALYFSEFVRWTRGLDNCSRGASPSYETSPSSSLPKCGVCLAAACLTRYDAWILAAAMCAVSVFIVFQSKAEQSSPVLRRGVRSLLLLAAAVPVLWLAYNAIVYRNPLEFANGPYSAKAIEARTPGASHPGSHDLPVAFSYFLKSGELNLASGNWQKLWILLALAGVVGCMTGVDGNVALPSRRLSRDHPAHRSEGEKPSERPAGRRRHRPLLLLWVPLPFYTLSVAYGGVPIFMPVWWPFSYYNVRYGLELLPAFAVFGALAVYFMAARARPRAVRLVLVVAALGCVAASYASIWRDPVCFREAWINSRTRISLEREVADFLRALPPDSNLLMYLGNHVGALQRAGIPLRRVINEGNHRTWKQPVDLEGLWERALANPAQYADFVIAFDGDPVAAGLQERDLTPLAVIHVSGQDKATIYQSHPHAR
jgi:hypothetical protein